MTELSRVEAAVGLRGLTPPPSWRGMPAWVPVVWLPSSGVEMGNGGVVSTPPSPGRVREGVGVNGRRKLPILGVPRPYNPQFLIFRFEILVLVLVGIYTVF